ncbi:hypothetical protein LTR91_003532 [Friedmanniomyces endolithicus]|uniref:Formyl transferase C-terminal domain-containing protein n=1 Tax=Friedmanniomyces endolithicus TaxID=329885 RepID=A0AAN6QZM1_9PEZI|nr:hypothetical protein LTS09_014815 [Friedmanniomyces endolithicus]KAK0325641.1 hypothetical protein LTR82_003177 [Friedmanniomyces endolithicus]KAK0926772.1 hypothetical protein LTR57_003814 [Friedmanniomyces endolithicus]KAK0992234.1 hypothetical protein LTS01_007923 [Friedmanniomyces endolithicus]KAK1006923.1 hypothetical protein LTR91_003532 [Friedmanniomyces endolithicus]
MLAFDLCAIPQQTHNFEPENSPSVPSQLDIMKILFLCTANNSLSQRLHTVLATSHEVTVEYAISDEIMISAATLAQSDLIICPFLTTLVPRQLYEIWMTIIIHPGPPGDAGPSALDWVLMGDDGSIDNPRELLQTLDHGPDQPGRTHWGVTVLQAIETFDAGPVWAFEQFPIDIDGVGMTKSEMYRGPITRAAVTATLRAISRIEDAALSTAHDYAGAMKSYSGCGLAIHHMTYSAYLKPRPDFGRLSVTEQLPFQGGRTHHRPLLKAADRDFDVTRHTTLQISRRIRSADSQPGVLSAAFGYPLYVYGGLVDEAIGQSDQPPIDIGETKVLATRNSAVCVATCDGKALWITHIRRPKTKTDKALHPKVPAALGLMQLGILQVEQVHQLHAPLLSRWARSSVITFQEVWVDLTLDTNANRTAYLYFDFCNGAMSSEQCSHLIDAMNHILEQHTQDTPLRAIVLMGGSYFSNGIALNVIEASTDPAGESWMNINRINDVVSILLHDFPQRRILTVAAVRGNAAAGGVALAAACDFVIAGSDVVLNPAYRAVGLHARCKRKRWDLSTSYSRLALTWKRVSASTSPCSRASDIRRGHWKSNVNLSPASLAQTRAQELSEMSKDFWSARSTRYHSRRHDFVRKVKPEQTPLRFATHRRLVHSAQYDEEELDSFDDVEYYEALACRRAADTLRDEIRKELGSLVAKWAESTDDMARAHRRGSVALQSEKAMAHVALPGIERKTETVFSCYYQPVEAPLTPPESPFQERQTAVLST